MLRLSVRVRLACSSIHHCMLPLHEIGLHPMNHPIKRCVSLDASVRNRPGLELLLGAEGDALELQYSTRWRRDSVAPPPREARQPMPHFHQPEDLVVFLERCSKM